MTRVVKWMLLLSSFISVSTYAQNTTVTATIVDPDGTIWANAPYTLVFRTNPNNPNQGVYNINGVLLNPAQLSYSGTTSGTGTISQAVYQNGVISPGGSQWTFSVCPLSSAPVCGSVNFTASGSTQNITSLVSIPLVRFPAVAGAYGYTDVEAQVTLAQGATYWNVTSQIQRYWNGSSWGNIGSGVYLPLAGGTLTGALNGTSASFSGAVTAGTIASNGTPSIDLMVSTFGAKGDGVTDDTAAVIAWLGAVNSIPGTNPVIASCPAGRTFAVNPMEGESIPSWPANQGGYIYNISRSGVRFTGGCKFVLLAQSTNRYNKQIGIPSGNVLFYWNYFVFSGSNIEIDHLWWDSNGQSSTTEQSGFGETNGYGGFFPTSFITAPNTGIASNINVHDTTHTNVHGWAINIANADQVRATNNLVTYGAGCVVLNNVSHATIENNTCSAPQDDQIQINSNGSGSQYVVAAGNIITGAGGNGGSGYFIGGSSDVLINGGTVDSVPNWCFYANKFQGTTVNRVLIKGLKCTGSTSGKGASGLAFNGESIIGDTTNLGTNSVNDFTVEGSTFSPSANSAYNANGQDLIIYYDTSNITFKNNRFTGCAAGTSGPCYPVTVVSSATNVKVIDNNDDGATTLIPYQLRLFLASPLEVWGNDEALYNGTPSVDPKFPSNLYSTNGFVGTTENGGSPISISAAGNFLGWNYSGGGGESDYFNSYACSGVNPSHSWYKNASGAPVLLGSLLCNGNFLLSIGGLSNANGSLIPSTATGNAGNATGKVMLGITGTTGSIGGSALIAGACATGTATISGGTAGHSAIASESDGSFIGGNYTVRAITTNATTITVNVCAAIAGTPVAKTYNVVTF